MTTPAVPRVVDVVTMALSPRTRFGSFEIVDVLGVGGMGEVYRATDVNLARDVAIKVLPSSFASDAERIARFEREARTIGSLNHPNVAHVYGLEKAGTLHGLVMELVDGLTLDALIARGPLSVEEAVRIALQIAAALEAAHARGIVHRDLKPANVKIKPDGTVKVLDFGIAKSTAGTSPSTTGQPTEIGITRSGFVVGTEPYMSPEQARGSPVDQRADIWSFGCVLYEMLAGRRAFSEGEDAAGPEVVDALPASVGPAVRQTLRLCLQRAPNRRLADIRDVRLALEGAFDGGVSDQHPKANLARTIAWATALVATAAAAASIVVWLRPDAPALRPPVRLAVDLDDVSLATDLPVTTLSPDGTRVVFVANGADGIAHLATRRLDEFGATPLPGTDGAYAPFFSPDGQWIGFFADGKLKKSRMAGGSPIVLCDAPAGRGASWADDGWIVAALDNRSGLVRVSATDGTVVPLTELRAGQVTHRWPQVLPGANAVLFTAGHLSGNYSAADIAVARLDGGGPAAPIIVREAAGMAPHYVETGHLAYVANGVLYAQPFDVDALEVRGAPVTMIDGVSSAVGFGSAQLAFSRTGALLYRAGQTPGRTVLRWLTADGRTDVLWDKAELYQNPRLSPDGLRLAVTVADGLSSEIWVYDLGTGNESRLTSGDLDGTPIWTPDGRHIVFRREGQLYAVPADGGDRPQPLVESANSLLPAAFTPNGSQLVYDEQLPTGGAVIQAVAINEELGRLRAGPPTRVHETTSGFPLPALSTNGRWIAFASAESGVYEVYVRAFPDDGRQWPVSVGGGSLPVWSPTAKEILYRTEDQVLMVASYSDDDGTFRATRPRPWSEQRLFNVGLVRNFDIDTNGMRVAVMLSAEGPSSLESHPIMLEVNFFDEVRRRASE